MSNTPKARRSKPRATMRAAAESVVRQLTDAGHVALFAGGCVRDMLMGKRPSDYDVATSAPPKTVTRLFRRTQQVGAKFGVVLVRLDGHTIEVATFRRDVAYSDGRRPTAVEFTDAREDAIRRDFTINGMFYDPQKREVVDHVGGQDDLKKRVIRAIGDAPQRFAEDHLRLLRAVRFAARFDFQIERGTWQAMCAHASEIAKISPERIREELESILAHPSRARAFGDLCECGVFGHLWPSAANVLPHREFVQKCLAALPADADFELAFAAILAPLESKLIGPAADALRCSTLTKRTLGWLHERQSALDEPSKLALADLKLLMAKPAFGQLLHLFVSRLKAADVSQEALREMKARVRRIRPTDIAPPPLFTGHDLEKLGLAKGPAYKRILESVYYCQLNEELSDRASAMAYAKQLVADETARRTKA